MKQIFIAGHRTGVGAGTADSSIHGSWAFTTSAPPTWWEAQCIATPGKIRNLRVTVDAGPGAGRQWVFSLMVNGLAKALTCTIAAAAVY
jgi:hypothetical protein